MQKILKKQINSIKYYKCGYCVNHMKYIEKHPKIKKKKFYAGVFLINHKKYGNILFDTGYSKEIYKCGLVGKIYNLLNPTFVFDKDVIDYKLKKDKININEIKYIVLSHLHPDHIGSLKVFKNAKFIISRDCYLEYKKNKIRNLIFKKLLPDDFEDKLIIVDKYELDEKYFKGFDLFNDGSIILTQVDGHAKGQLGLLLKEHNVFLGGDAAWGMELATKVDEMSIFAKFIQNNFEDYKKSINLLLELNNAGYKVYLSHGDYNFKELIK